jgi:hypothetical protein
MATRRSRLDVVRRPRVGRVTILSVFALILFGTRSADGAMALADRSVSPGATSVDAPTAAPVLVTVTGSVVTVGDGWIGVHEPDGDAPVAFLVGPGSQLVRSDRPVTAAALRPGDRLRMTVDGRTGQILLLEADPASAGLRRLASVLGWLVPVGLIVGAAIVWARTRSRAWLTVANVESLRPVRSVPRVQRVTAFGRGYGWPTARLPCCR